MIQANELRIGNLVDILHPISKKWNFERIKAKTIANIEHNPNHDLIVNNIAPIPLTPEILEKCGFKLYGKNNWFYIFEENFSIEYTNYLGEFYYFMCGYSYSHSKIEYLHQLQNLYFALTGNEFEINL